MNPEIQMYISDLNQSMNAIYLQLALFLLWVILGPLISWRYINTRGKKFKMDGVKLYQWRMAALFLGPLAAIAFYFSTKKNK